MTVISMETVKIANEKLKIPTKYLKNITRPNKVEAIVHRSWMSQLLAEGRVPSEFIHHDLLSPQEVEARLKQGECFGPTWQRILLKVVWKRDSPVISLPRPKTHTKPDTALSYCQILHYVSHTNHKNLWKEVFKKYSRGSIANSNSHVRDRSKVRLTDSATVLRDIISRAYGCPVVSLNGVTSEPTSLTSQRISRPHPNLLPCHIALETSDYFILIYDGVPSHTLLNCVTFSPAVLQSHSRSMFLVYQLLSVLRHVHDQGLVLGDVSLEDVHLDQHLWAQVVPKLESNLYELPQKPNLPEVTDMPQPFPEHIGSVTLAWVRGAVSNLDYLTALNKLAGRRYGDPRCHHVLPWVTDFSSHNGANWRDLTRSKFRLNKGDKQLDLTYELPASANTSQVPHHISDVLSEITYYVYLARITPRSVLCRYVRPQWVPAEYPTSIQRLQQWTPDECIPEFFTDPSVFKSIHPDLPDLELPPWATSAEQLIAHHRAALESNYVSDRLHHWIDLTFGYKLSGQAAVKSKNVCLQLVDGHTGLVDCGVVQLFTMPHPQRATPSPYWGIAPPRIHHRDRRKPVSEEEEEGGPSSGGEDNSIAPAQSSPLALPRLLSRSRNSLSTSGASPQGTIVLPHDYSPVTLLASVEAMHSFTGPVSTQSDSEVCVDSLSQAKQVVAAARHQEMQVLGCLVVEMFLPSRFRLFDHSLHFPQRLSICRSILATHRDSMPRCVRSLVTLLLDDSGNESPVTSIGTPSPSAHQLLQPALSSSILPLSPSFPMVYSLVTALHEYTVAVSLLQQLRESHPDHEEILTASIERLSEKKVQSAAKYIYQLLEQPNFSIELVLSYVLQLLGDPDTAVSAAWLLFDPVAKALGSGTSRKVLLEPLVRLYDCDSTLYSQRALKKRLKLYHRSFLLRLIVRFRLRVFLDHFVTLLVEAVGGCHDVDFMLPPNTIESADEIDCPGFLSPLDEDSSADSEKTPVSNKLELGTNSSDTYQEPEVFVLETEDCGEVPDQSEKIASLLLDLQADDTEETPAETQPQSETQRCAHVEEQWVSTEEKEQSPAMEYNKVSEVGVASVQWLAHRLGPVLTATHLTRNLLRMLSLCYAGPGLTAQNGDDNAAGVLQCLAAVVGLYGEQFIVVQYLPVASDVVTQARRRLTASLEGGVVGHLSLLTYALPLLSDNMLHQLFQDVILSRICGPCLRLLASTRQLYPSGPAGRRALVVKLVGTLHALMLRATTEQKIVLIHTVSRLFSVFSKARGQLEDNRAEDPVTKVRDMDCSGSFSPPQSNTADCDSVKSKALEELSAVMSAELAHWAYTPFANFFGESLMEQSLKNYSLIKHLCADHIHNCDSLHSDSSLVDRGDSDIEDSVGSFGTNVIVTGNRIDLQEHIAKSASPNAVHQSVNTDDHSESSSKQRIDNTSRYLRGNWLSYWQHEVSTGQSAGHLDVKQIRLLGFSGHTNSIRALTVLDNENSFLSASRDKTVKVWSLRSMGDGSTTCPAQWTYTGHRKCVLSVGFCETARLAVSCDSSLHLWDPYVGRVLVQMDPTKSPPINTLKPLPPPSYQVLAATTDPTLRTFDTRVGGYVNELKVPSSSAGLIRCIAVTIGGNLVALGQASGHLTVMDLRTGSVLSAWRAHDAEILQLLAINDHTIVSSSLDQAISVWNPSDGKLKFNMKGPTEPVHCLDLYGNELVSGTTANRIGVHTNIDPEASFSSTRLRTDGFRGVITNIQVLPLNRLLLLGADSGAITLIC